MLSISLRFLNLLVVLELTLPFSSRESDFSMLCFRRILLQRLIVHYDILGSKKDEHRKNLRVLPHFGAGRTSRRGLSPV